MAEGSKLNLQLNTDANVESDSGFGILLNWIVRQVSVLPDTEVLRVSWSH